MIAGRALAVAAPSLASAASDVGDAHPVIGPIERARTATTAMRTRFMKLLQLIGLRKCPAMSRRFRESAKRIPIPRDKSRGTRGLRKPAPRGGLIATDALLLDVWWLAEERVCVGEEVVGERAEERDAGDLFQAADQDVGGAVMGLEVRVDELAEAGS